MTILLAASGGGHLRQLWELRPRLGIGDAKVVWAVPDNPQSRSLLAGEDVVWLPYAHPRDARGVIAAGTHLFRSLRSTKISAGISTGASPALSAMPSIYRSRCTMHYIESAARVLAPSLTGSIMDKLPSVKCYAQYKWGRRSWLYVGCVLDGFKASQSCPPHTVRKVIVTVGVNGTYRFSRLIDALQEVLPKECDVLWQIDDQDRASLPADATIVSRLPAAEMARQMADADVVISHAGAGSAITALRSGKVPVLLARRSVLNEHVDDHQHQVLEELASRGLAFDGDAGLSVETLEKAAAMRVHFVGGPPLDIQW
jgi:UDP-N-acetylglucosamine--N-acetylmuramyl-(pentapeptide) pyrophosphoryl-undecaprenol N-acetylglucosamine transferase